MKAEPTREAKGRVSPILAAVVVRPTAGALMDGFQARHRTRLGTAVAVAPSKMLGWVLADSALFAR